MRPTPPFDVWIGWDVRELRAWNVAAASLRTTSLSSLAIHKLALPQLIAEGKYTRPTRQEDGRLWDEISAAPMSTGHAIARFFVPYLANYRGWALFTDGDVLFRRDIAQLFALADPAYAVQVVQHQYQPTHSVKMDNQAQTMYTRKNWSSVVLWNASHPANQALTPELVNTVPGRDLHRFCWLDDRLIGALDVRWNWLVGHSPAAVDPAIVHFTEGVPDMRGYEHQPYADEWYDVAKGCGYNLERPAKPAVA